MLQRIQTIYMIISATLLGALYVWFPNIVSEEGLVVIHNDEPIM